MVCCLKLSSAREGLGKKKVTSLGLNNSLVESLNTSHILSCIQSFLVILLLTIKFKTKSNKNIPTLPLKRQEFDKKTFVVSESLYHIEDDCCVHSSNFYGSWNSFLLCILNNFFILLSGVLRSNRSYREFRKAFFTSRVLLKSKWRGYHVFKFYCVTKVGMVLTRVGLTLTPFKALCTVASVVWLEKHCKSSLLHFHFLGQ